jgi:ATP synthase protein I
VVAVGAPSRPSDDVYGARLQRITAYRLVAAQLITTIGIAGVLLIFAETRTAYSALAGGLACVIPNAYLATRMFGAAPTGSPVRLLLSIYIGEAMKLGLTLALLIVALLWLGTRPLPTFATYVAMIAVNWVALLWPDPARPPPGRASGSHLQAK